jgi:chromosome segregation ATPase
LCHRYAPAAHDELQATKTAAAAEAADGAAVQEQFEAAVATHSTAEKTLHYYQDKKAELAGRIVDDEKSAADYKLVLAAKIDDAKRVCDRETAEGYLAAGEAEMEANALQTRWEKAKKMVEKESKRHARPQEEVNRALADSKRKFKRLQTTLRNARDPCERLKKGVKQRQRLLRETSHAVNKEVSHRFNYYMAKKGHAGKVLVDYKNATLELDVKMHGQGQTVKDTRSMSGGERSYSTLALTLSLGESIESPFRAMDEFDVFMDAVNRKVSMDALIAFSRDPFNKDKQFLFITPQDISAVDASAKDIKVQKMKAARPN